MKKSTKILLILLGCVVVVAAILIIIFRNQIFASPTPEPQDKTDATTTSDQTEAGVDPNRPADDKPVGVGECKWEDAEGDPNQPIVDSGLNISLTCKNVDEVNAAKLNEDGTYSLTFDYSFTFTKSCNEYIKDPMIYWNLSNETERLDEVSVYPFDHVLKTTTKKSGKITHTFKMGERYGIYYGLPIWASIPIWSNLGVDKMQQEMYSNGCYVRRMPNPEDTTGTDISVSDDKGITGSNTSACEDECTTRQKCRSIADPICNGFCSMSCAIMDMVAGLFNFSFGLLHKAVGLS